MTWFMLFRFDVMKMSNHRNKLFSFSLLLISIITYILLSLKNIATFSYYEEDFFSHYFTDYVVHLDENGRIWCDCKEFERSSCKKFGPLTFRECPPSISLKVKKNEIPILIAPHIAASTGLLLRLYVKVLQWLGTSGEKMKDRIILFRSFGVIVGVIFVIILIFFVTSKIFGHPAAGISSVLLSTNQIFILASSSFSTTILLVDYLPVIVLLTISLVVSTFIIRIKIGTKVKLISASVLLILLFPFILYQLMYSGEWNNLKIWASPIKYAYHRLMLTPESFIKNFFHSLIFVFLNNLPDGRMGWWILRGTGQNYFFEIVRGIVIFIGFLNFFFMEKGRKLKYILVMLILTYVFLLSLFDISSNHYVVPSLILYIACGKGVAGFKIRVKFRLIPLYIPFVFIVILFSAIGFIINSKKLIEANPDKLLEPKLQVLEFLIRNNIKRVVEVSPDHHIPIGILTDGKIKVVSYLLGVIGKFSGDDKRNVEEREKIIKEIFSLIFSLERNSIFIGGWWYHDDIYHDDIDIYDFYVFVKYLGFEVRELFGISVGQYYLSVFIIR